MKRQKLLLVVLLVACAAFGGVRFEAATPVWPTGQEKAMNTFFRFRAEYEADGPAILRVTAGYDYKAWIDGAFVGFGPARAAPGLFRVDEWPVAAKPGRRVVEIDVAGYNCNNFYLPDQTPFLQAEVVAGGRVVARTAADGGFTAQTTGRVRKVPRFSYQRTFMEVYRLPHAGCAVPLAEQSPKRLLPRAWPVPDFHVLRDFTPKSLEKVAWDASVTPKTVRCVVPAFPGYKLFPLGELEENPYFDVQRLKTVARMAAPRPTEDGWHPLAAGEGIVFAGPHEEAGFPQLRVRCSAPTTIYFTFDEMLQPDGSVDQFRAGTVGTLVWHLGKGDHDLEGFEPIAFKCARVLAVGGAAEVSAPSVRTYVSPSAARASFRSSDPALAKIFDAARRSYVANAVDCLTDCPIRERAGWLGDTFFTGRASKWLTGSTENERLFFENFILPDDYGAPEPYRGLVPAVWPVDLMEQACFIPNWNLWLFLELEEFVHRGGDPAVVAAFRPKLMDALAWFDRHVNADGLLEKLPGWVFVEWSQANKLVQDVNYPTNMMFAKALDALARLYGLPELTARAARIRETVRRQSRMPDGWYCDNAVRQADGTLKLSGECTETCQYYAFFTGVADKERDAELWRRLVEDFGPDRVAKSRWKRIWPSNFIFGTCLRLELLSRDGRGAQIYREVRDYFLKMAETTGTLWEHGDTRASCCHGFASIAVEYLIRDVLGYDGLDPATGQPIVRPPKGLDVDWCEATIPVSATETVTVRSSTTR